MRYMASVSYDGSSFYGFQKLNNHKTVQGELEKSLTKINKTLCLVKGAGRTDRGVHAVDQVIHFDLNINIDEQHLKKAINSIIDKSIYVNYCQIVNDSFHARHSVRNKVYEYAINTGEYNPIENKYIYNYCHKLNLKIMKKAAHKLLGIHSYKSFVSGTRDNYNSEIKKIKFFQKKDILIIRFEGKSFYRYMIRNLVGCLIAISEGKITLEELNEMLNEKEIKYKTAPACGLYLVKITY